MALGGNLKKKSLIPTEDKKPQEKAEEEKPKATPKSKKKAASKAAPKKATAKKTKSGKSAKAEKAPVAKQKAAPAPKAEPKPEPEETKPVEESKPIEETPEPQEEVQSLSVPEAPKIQEEEPKPAPIVIKRAEPVEAEEVVEVAIPAPVKVGGLTKLEFQRRQKLHEKFSKEIKDLEGKQVHLIVFRIEQEEFAIEISKVNEVVVTPTITRMPQSPKYVPGIATIRGKGVVTIDLAYKLGYVGSSDDLAERSLYTIVIKTERFTVGVLVPEVPVSQIVAGGRIQPAGDNVSETSIDETYIKGLIKTGDRVIFYMDIDEMIEGDRLRGRLVEE